MDRTGLIVLLLGGTFGAGACAAHTPGPRALSMEAALQQARAADARPLSAWIRAGLQGPGTFGTGQPGVPVVVPPDIRRVWVPTHENAEGELIAGHWVFLRVRDFRWFLESAPARDAGAAGRPPEWQERASGAGAGGGAAIGVPWVEVAPGGSSGASRSGVPGGAAVPPPRSAPATSPSTTPGR